MKGQVWRMKIQNTIHYCIVLQKLTVKDVVDVTFTQQVKELGMKSAISSSMGNSQLPL